ncbi:MAG: DUF6036 family nucleotidyltransferase [Candidatus Hadarchaeota archaeon]|nr:DUF6036 family nucleotidyltransferase [Candidatus Hadarchaeota archaeon]
MRLEEMEEMLREIDSRLERKVTLFTIGGTAMIFRGQKDDTQDVDFIALDEEGLKIMGEALNEMGFIRPPIGRSFEHPDGRRIEVDVGGFSGVPLTERMLKRVGAAPLEGLDKLELLLASNEDLILFKSMGERKKDVEDVASILSKTEKIEWRTILDEVKELTQESATRGEPTLYPGFVAVKLREVKGLYGGVDEKIIREFEDLTMRLNREIRRRSKR